MAMLDEMRKTFGDAATDSYIREMKAVDALVTMYTVYQDAPNGSPEEAVARTKLDAATAALKASPDHAVGLVEALIAIVLSMRRGDTYEAWFNEVGIEVLT